MRCWSGVPTQAELIVDVGGANCNTLPSANPGVLTQAELLAASMASIPHWMLLSVMVIVAMLKLMLILVGKEASATLKFAARSGMTVSILCATTLLPSCIGK